MAARVLRRAAAVVLLVLAVCALWTAVVLGAVRNDLQAAREELEAATEANDADEVALALARGQGRLQRSVDRLGQPGPAVIARVPVVGRSVEAIDVTAQAALAVTSASRQVVEATEGASLLPEGGVSLEGLRTLGAALTAAGQQTQAPVAALVEQSHRFLPGPVAGPVGEAQDRLAPAPDAFSRAGTGVEALGGLLGADGPRRLLVVLENNAELRGTGGLVSVFATATAQDGRLDVGGFRDVVDVAAEPEEAVRVPAPDDYVGLWGPYLANSTLWVNTNMSPDIPTSSDVLADVAAATLPEPPDAVLWLDVPAIAGVLEATGPVALPDGSELRGEDAVDVLLSRAYVDAPDTVEGQAQRRETLRAVADAVLSRLLGGAEEPPSLTALGPALADAALGRHLAVWSAREGEQAQLVEAGLAGALEAGDGDVASFTVQNLGGGDTEGNKLDYYARRSVEVRALVGDDATDVAQTVTLQNDAPSTGLPRYVAGGVTPGTTNNLVTFALPSGAEEVVLRRAGRALDSPPRPAGDHSVVTDLVSLPAGTGVTWELTYRLPREGDDYRLRLYPQPLHAPGDLRVELSPAEGRRLAVPAGSDLEEGDGNGWVLDQAFATTEDLEVVTERPNLARRVLDGIRSFWTEPVTLP